MTIWIAFFLGVVQGLTEFFPVSSSAHLKLAKMVFGVTETPVLFDLSCHLGTLAALLWFFKKEVAEILISDRKKILYLSLALLPLFPIYFLLKTPREYLSAPRFLGVFLMVTGLLLFFGQRFQFKKRGKMIRDLLLIGTMQGAALIPGLSRSASTISCAKVLGWSPNEAVRFSFLLAIPTIIGGNLVEMRRLVQSGELRESFNLECFIGMATSFIVGMGVIRLAMHLLERDKLSVFAWYCLGLGSLVTLYLIYAT